jgi:hypothetical protein
MIASVRQDENRLTLSPRFLGEIVQLLHGCLKSGRLLLALPKKDPGDRLIRRKRDAQL